MFNFAPLGFNDRARSAIVSGGRWEVCEDADFAGRCVVLRPGNYDSLSGMGMYKRVSSVRPEVTVRSSKGSITPSTGL